jgi:hypothetical protein
MRPTAGGSTKFQAPNNIRPQRKPSDPASGRNPVRTKRLLVNWKRGGALLIEATTAARRDGAG